VRPIPLYDQIIEHIIRLNNKHHVGRIFVDASNTAFTSSLKQRIGDTSYRSYATDERSIINDANDPRLRQNSSKQVVFPVDFLGFIKRCFQKLMNEHIDVEGIPPWRVYHLGGYTTLRLLENSIEPIKIIRQLVGLDKFSVISPFV
jgi:hypothetical protein